MLAIVLAVFSACSDEDNTPGGNKTGTEGFFALDAASLKDWDYGVSDGRCCLVVKTDSVGGVLACAIDKDSGRARGNYYPKTRQKPKAGKPRGHKQQNRCGRPAWFCRRGRRSVRHLRSTEKRGHVEPSLAGRPLE